MNWKRASKYHLLSDQGYKVAKYYIGIEIKYGAFTPKDDFDYESLGLFDGLESAKEACEVHFNGSK